MADKTQANIGFEKQLRFLMSLRNKMFFEISPGMDI